MAERNIFQRMAAFIKKTSVAAYAREVLLKDADNVIKKASKPK